MSDDSIKYDESLSAGIAEHDEHLAADDIDAVARDASQDLLDAVHQLNEAAAELEKSSTIENNADIRLGLIVAIRELLEHRALWLYLLCDEARKVGYDPAKFAPAAIERCGIFQGANLVEKGGGTQSLKSLKKGLFGPAAQMVFEMDIKDVDDDRFELEFGYCPLVKAWQKQGATEEEISQLCDWAMCGDRGIGKAYGCELDLPKTLARGDEVCHLIYHRPEK